MRVRLLLPAALVCMACCASVAEAQYFGSNKVRYEELQFRRLRTDHFDIYFSSRESGAAQIAGRMAERWYALLSAALDHQLSNRQPVVLYGSHPDFAQTTVVSGFLGEEIGGVTESIRRRIAMPISAGLAETNRVLGHEIVHAFQYDISDQTGKSLNSVPLWFVEGMAEYFVTRQMDAQTEMVLLDAARHKRFPSIRALERFRISPYRSGQAFWAWIADRFGEDIIAKILKAPHSNAFKRIESVTKTPVETLTEEWQDAIKALADARGGEKQRVADGSPVVGWQEGDGRINLAPSLSPDGTRLIFLSERDHLSIDVFVADAATGVVQKKLVTTAANPKFDSLQFLSSAAAWSPDGKHVLLAVVRQSQPVLAIYDVDRGALVAEHVLEDLDQVFYPSWSPDGRTLAFTGLKRGQSDLYRYNLDTKQLSFLTNDAFADLQPVWSPDGERIAFVSDRFTTDLTSLEFGPYRLGLIDPATRAVTPIPGLPEGATFDPQWLPDGSGLYFRGSPAGVSDIFRVDLATHQWWPITMAENGVTSVTTLSPALSIARSSGRLAFTVYRNGIYGIRTLESPAPLGEAHVTAERESPAGAVATEPTRTLAAAASTAGVSSAQSFPVEGYKSNLGLDAIGQPYFFMSGGGTGTVLQGGMSFLFGDMLSSEAIGVSVQAGTTLESLAADVQYLNRSSRWNWGLSAGLQPYVYGFEQRELTSGETAFLEKKSERHRQMHLSFSGIAAYPFDRAKRIEGRARLYTIWSQQRVRSRVFQLPDGELVSDESFDGPQPRPLSLFETSVAFVRDTAIRGPVSPLLGQRTRLEIAPTFGGSNFVRALADYRQYWMPARPFTLAIRAMHVGRYGLGANDQRILPLSLSRGGLVRGYNGQGLEYLCDASEATCSATDMLAGTKVATTQIELRFPLRGLLSRSLEWGPVPVEGVVFTDAAAAWTSRAEEPWRTGGRPVLVTMGAGIRTSAAGFGFELDVVRKMNWQRPGWSIAVRMQPGF